ncbi:hypothetical protein [Alsobacter sp. R-9]
MSQESKEPFNQSIRTASDREARLGLHYDIPGVDPENVALFAKIARLVGLGLVVAFVWWGLFDTYHPFEDLAAALGIGWRNRAFFSYGLGAVILALGWFLRFRIGNLFFVAIFAIWGLITRLFRSV